MASLFLGMILGTIVVIIGSQLLTIHPKRSRLTSNYRYK